MVIAVRRWLIVFFVNGVSIRSTCIMGLRPCHTKMCGRRELLILNIGWTSGGGESVVVHIGRPDMVRIIVCDGGVGRSITVSYVLWCRIGWTAFDSGDTCLECVKVGPKLGDQGVGEMPEATAVIREATAVFDQLICCNHVNFFHLFVQARGSSSDEVGGSRNEFVHVAEDSISRRDALISLPDALI